MIAITIYSLVLTLFVSRAEASSLIREHRDYLTPATASLPEGSLARNTVIFLCDPNDWPRVVKGVPPPAWLQEPPGSVLLVGPFRHSFSCQNVQLRGNDEGRVVTLGGPSESAPPALGGCAIAVSRSIRGEPIMLDGYWSWKQRLATLHACSEAIKIPETDYADRLRIRLHAVADRTTGVRSLQGAKVQLIGPYSLYNNTVVAENDEMAIFQQVPATDGYEVLIEPVGCRRFDVWHQEILAGRDVVLDVDLGTFSTLAVRVTQDTTAGRRPLSAALVRIVSNYESYLGSAETDQSGQAIVSCLPADSKVDLRVTHPGYFWADQCGVMVGPRGQSQIDVVLAPDPDPRRRLIPPVCVGARTQQSPQPTPH